MCCCRASHHACYAGLLRRGCTVRHWMLRRSASTSTSSRLLYHSNTSRPPCRLSQVIYFLIISQDIALRSQLSVREQFQDGSRKTLFTANNYLTIPVWSVVYSALESVTVLWRPRNYRDIIIINSLDKLGQ